jgi:hypothetical protein
VKIKVSGADTGSNRGDWARLVRTGLHSDIRRGSESHRGMRVRQVEFSPTVKADPVGAVLDSEHAAEVTVPTAKDELNNRQ